MKIFAIIGTLITSTGLALAQMTNSYPVSSGAAIPVGNPVGLVSSLVVTGLMGDRITDITVSLNISGGYNGDLYAYLTGPTGSFNVLLNQSGNTGPGTIGYLDNGFNITLDDRAADSIQNYETTSGVLPANTPLTGSWQSAGDDLASFAGTDPNGTWTLFVANLTSGSPPSTLNNWSLTLVTTPTPEPSIGMLMGCGLIGLIVARRRIWTRRSGRREG